MVIAEGAKKTAATLMLKLVSYGFFTIFINELCGKNKESKEASMAFGLGKFFNNHNGKIIEQWVYDAKSPLVCGAAIAQLYNPTQHQVIFGTKDGKLICIDETGKELWTFAEFESLSEVESFFVDDSRVHSINAAPVVYDIDNDGRKEILFCNELGMIYCLNDKGKLVWKFSCGGGIKAGCAVADINSDGIPEIIIGSTSGKLFVLDNQGKKIFEYDTTAPIESVPAVLKTDKVAIIFGNNNGTLFCINPAQELQWRCELGHKITAAPVFFKDPEEHRMIIGNLDGEVYCISEHGEIVWTYKTKGSIYGAAAIADLNNDKQPEIVIGSCDNSVYALNAAGKKIWSYETDFWIITTPLIADIDGDGKLEVIVGSFDHNVYVLDGEGKYMLDYMPGISDIVNQSGNYSNIMTKDPGEQKGKKLYQYKAEGIIVGCSILEREKQKPALIINITTGKIGDIEHKK